ncbi:uncharacterized protein KY384_008769 [Bacidia gigantensis]|uniref:uncharacterized protein n=1 Tax=Bacidia gigantensis TaxID=2732470 RepID=UPI001D042209|nr:uncharacterized protein KY384_008769 [Bacidia gigantensis]KAG8526568.1 hypothetical protein KY384_008769 [Bacidia gigantensis]
MAAVVHTGSISYHPPPSHSQTSTDSLSNGIQPSHSTMTSFEAPQSSATTPTPTPPTSRQQHVPYPPSSFGVLNGSHGSLPNPRPSPSSKPPGQRQYNPGYKPQIYTAVYSGVSVYEMEIDGLAVMRRRNDSWMNATQILKLAGIDKGKRTKVLEKEILNGEHEKVQGGYGKYQGTWISYNRAIEFAKGYGVVEPLRPLLEYDMGQEGQQAGAGNLNTPTKEQAMAAQRKRNMMNGGLDRGPAQSPNGTFFKNMSKSAANAVNAINKARFDSPAPRPASGAAFRRPSQQVDTQDSAYANSSQQSMRSLHSEPSFGNGQLDPALREREGPYYKNIYNALNEEPPQKRMKASFSQDTKDANGTDVTTRDGHDHDGYTNGISPSKAGIALMGLPPLKHPSIDLETGKPRLISSLFFDPTREHFADHPAMLKLSSHDMDIPIDKTGHTALHWAATLGKPSLVRALVQKGASVYRLNNGGETPLVRSVRTTNNLTRLCFPELLEFLGPTIEIRDDRDRTVLHHIAVSSSMGPDRAKAARYYLESLLEYVVRSGSATNSQANSFHDPTAPSKPRPIGLARFMNDIVNAQDLSGDTALNLVARLNNKTIAKQLLEVGGNPAIPNCGGLKPSDFGVRGEYDMNDDTVDSQVKAPDAPPNRVTQSSQELLSTIKTFVAETETSFNANMQSKQSLIDQSQSNLKESTRLLNEERERLKVVQEAAEKRKALRQRISNLKAANEQHRQYLGAAARADIKLGEADAGLEVDATILPPPPYSATDPLELDENQKSYVSSLPTAAVIEARKRAYKQLNDGLEKRYRELKSQSFEAEGMLRKLVALCTGVGEEKVDEQIARLVRVMGKEEIGERESRRVREFLRRVEGEKLTAYH